MSTQVFHCSDCDLDFEVNVPFREQVPRGLGCPKGAHYAFWKISAPAAIIVEGGTGAGKDRKYR